MRVHCRLIRFVFYCWGTIMARGKHCCYMKLFTYHVYQLESHTEVIQWREVTPEMVTKYEAFSKRCMEDYVKK